MILAAAIAVSAYGEGLIVGDSYSELHVDPIGFFSRMRFAWDPQVYLGTHTGWMHGYVGPYGLSYAVLAALDVPAAVAEHVVIFGVELLIAGAMYWGLGALEPALPRFARLCGSLAYLFNIYVAFNLGNGYSSFLMPYAVMPIVLGISAKVVRGSMHVLAGGIAVAAWIVVAGGVNPPLLVILAIVTTLCLAVEVALGERSRSSLGRAVRFAAVATAATLALNAYWIVPFLDYGRTFWIGSQLDESPIMHNVDTSFFNVVRGFGQWGIFRGDATGPWFPWAAWFTGGPFYVFSWFEPIVAFAGLVPSRGRTKLTIFAVVLAVISVPIVVGYHADLRGPALTVPIYDFMYSHVPGFQMFRSAYKWVWPLEFSLAVLFATAVATLQGIAGDLRRRGSKRLAVLPMLGAAVLLGVPVLSFVPMLVERENHAVPAIPTWYAAAKSVVRSAPEQRVAIFPGQYVPQYDWADQVYYIENSYLPNNLLAGYISGAPNEGSHLWLTRSFRTARDGDPSASDAFRMLGADAVLARDDFRSESDFAYVGENTRTDTTEMHDTISSVLGARPVATVGALRSYALARALPDVYVSHDVTLSPLPAIAIASAADPAELAAGRSLVSADAVDAGSLATSIVAGLGMPGDFENLDALATTLSLDASTVVTSVQEQNAFRVPARGAYDVFSLGLPWMPKNLAESWYLLPEQIGTNYTDPLRLVIDGTPEGVLPGLQTAWKRVTRVRLERGWHTLHVDRLSLRPFVLIALVPDEIWRARRTALAGLAATPRFLSPSAVRIDGTHRALYVPRSGAVRLRGAPAIASDAPAARSSIALSERPDTDFASLRSLSPAQIELPYVPSGGTTMSTFRLMPKPWYLDPETFAWNRGGPTDWCLLTRDAHFSVFSPAPGTAVVESRLRLALVASHADFAVFVNGRPQGSIDVAADGPVARDVLGTRGPLMVRPPVTVSFDVRLRPGYNDVRLRTNAEEVPADRIDAALDPGREIVAASAWDSAFVLRRDARSGKAPVPQAHTAFLQPLRIPIEGLSLSRDVRIAGRIALDVPKASAWLAELIEAHPGSTYSYRILPISVAGELNNSLAVALKNSDSDASARVERAWIVFGSSAAGAFRRGNTGAIDELHLEFARNAGISREIPLDTAAVDTVFEAAARPNALVRRNGFLAVLLPTKTPFRSSVTFDLPTGRFAEFTSAFKENRITAAIRLDVLRHGRWEPAGDQASVSPVRRARASAVTVVLPERLRPQAADLLQGRVLMRFGQGPIFACASPASTQPAASCVVTGTDAAGVSRFALTAPGKGMLHVFVPIYAKPSATNTAELAVPNTYLRDARRVRIVADGTTWVGPLRPGLVVLSAAVEREIAGVRSIPLRVDSKRFSSGVLRAGRHLVTSDDAGADIGDLRVMNGERVARTWEPVKAARPSPVALDITLPPSTTFDALVLNESYHPEWAATSDHARLQHVWLDGYANGWLVPKHAKPLLVHVRFAGQRIYDAALAISGASALLMALVIVYRVRPPRAWSR